MTENLDRKENSSELLADDASLTPQQIVAELDRYVIAQEDAKRAVAIAMRNRWRRLRVPGEMREEITPKNIIMVGPTGVGKTEISRRLAKLTKAPFVKVEASKFTEVGYVGRDVESIIRDLAENAVSIVRKEERAKVREKAVELAEEKLLDLLLPDSERGELDAQGGRASTNTREKLREMLRAGKLESRIVEVETVKPSATHFEIVGHGNFGALEDQLKDVFSNMMPKQHGKKKLSVKDAREVLTEDVSESLIDEDLVTRLALARAEQNGIVFIDEIDKICGQHSSTKGPDVSREGVQRDLLPLVEGCTVSTKYGSIKTDHVLFIASGAFHFTKPSDLMPEFQGRFPIRVELRSLTPEQFVRILKEPKSALIKQYTALLATEDVELEFSDDAIDEIARLTAEVNSRTENIGARRLHTLLEKLLDDVLFSADEFRGRQVRIDGERVRQRLSEIVTDVDLSRFIL